MSKLKN
jgi:hypothetical protein